MERESWRQIIDEQNDLPETDTGEYSLDEILLQFRFEYSDQETEETMSRETETIFTEEVLPDGVVTEQGESPEVDEQMPTEVWNNPEEADGEYLSDNDSDRMTATEEKNERREAWTMPHFSAKNARRNARFNFKESLESTLGKLRKKDHPAVNDDGNDDLEGSIPEVAPVPFDPIAELKESQEAWDSAEEHFPEWNLNTAPASETMQEQAEYEQIREQETSKEPKQTVRAGQQEDTRPRHERISRRKRKVVEEFPPEQEPEETAPSADADPVDYSALFHMFTEESLTDAPVGDSPAEETYESFLVDQDLFSGLEWNPTDETGIADTVQSDTEEKPAEPDKTPLFAESTESSLDFRDILRDFMLGDQHPIYADMPGIGKKAEPVMEEHEAMPASGGKRETVSEKRAPRDYTVVEDFPMDLGEFLEDKEKPEEAVTETPPAEEPGRESKVEDEPEESKESEKREKGLRSLLRGLGTHSPVSRKRALNEPKAFASFEDYIQPEEEKPSELKEEADPSADEEDKTQQTETAESESVFSAEQGEERNPDAAEDEKTAEPTPEEDDELLYTGEFPSFGQWILNELMTFWIRLNGIGDRESTATMEDDNEDLGKEVNVANASRYYGSQVTMLRMRFQIGLVILAVLAYITLGFPVSGMLKTAEVLAAMCLGLQLTVMLLCLDVVTNAAVNLTRRKFGADALAVLFCIITSFDALAVAVGGFGTQHVPLCLFSSLALMGILLSSLLSARALRKSTRVPAIAKRVYCVTAEEGVRGGGDLTLLKSVRPTAGFVRRAEEAPPDESLFRRTAAVQLLAALVLSLVTAIIKHCPGDLLYVISAVLTCAVPVTALLAFALPYFIGSQRIFSSGAAVAGWSGIHDIGCSRNLIVTDRDLFPEDTIAIETVRIFADDSAERIIGFAGTMIAASGSGLGACFAELMEKNNCRMRNVEDFRWLAGGGLQGRIEGHTVLCGSSDLMQLMNVKIPYRLVDRTTVLLAIDGVLYGIFKINYTGLPEIRTALQELIASNRHPIFAIRDFNVTPEMLHEVFDVATDGYDFPPYGDRFRISEAQPSETSKVSAVVCREGLGPLTHLADTGRSMYVAVRINLLITAAVAVLGMLMVFVKLIGTGLLSPWLPFVLLLLDAIIVTLVSLFMRF